MADGGPKAEEQEVVVEAVRVSGNKRTQRRALDAALADVSAQRSLKGLKCALQESTERLERSGSFHSVDAVLDAGSGPKAAQVQLSLTERDPFSFSAGTYLRAGEASVEARLRSRNGLGLLEDLSLNASRGTNSSTSLRLSASFPLVSKPSGTSIDGVAFASESNFQRHSSFSERLTGASASLSLPNSHLAYDLAWRELTDLSKHHTASRAIRSQLGHGIRSSLRYSISHDIRDSDAAPSRGYSVQSNSELCGVCVSPGVVQALKQELIGEVHVPLSSLVGISLSARTGVDSMRGFSIKGIGPNDERRALPEKGELATDSVTIDKDSLGGDILAVAKAALNVGIPVEALQELGAHVHIFGQAGTLGLLAGPGAQSIREVMTDGMRFSCGVGLVVPIPVGRIEVNFCHAIRSHKVDRAHDGLQVGFSASF